MENITLKSKPLRRVTLHDIAREAGVTVGTVSGVLRGKTKERRISNEVAERIWQVADEMDYSPNLLVRSLQHGSTHIVSFFNGFRSRERRDAYMDTLTTGIERAGGVLGYNILVYCDFRVAPDAIYQYINGGHNDGLIFFKPQLDDPLLPYLRRSNLPVVLLNAIDEEGVLPAVSDDWRGGIREIAARLLDLGHRRIAALTGSLEVNDAQCRPAYLNSVLMESGVTIPERWWIPVDAKRPEDSYSALRFLMSEPEPPTAIFCWHDYVGYRILEDCEALGISVPKQLSVVGYDGLRWPAKTKHILASVRVDLDGMGEAAVKMLVDLITGNEAPPEDQLLPVHFDAGTTLGPPRR